MKDQIEEFRAYRAKMNERILAADNKVIPHLRRAVEYWELLQAQTGPEVENEK